MAQLYVGVLKMILVKMQKTPKFQPLGASRSRSSGRVGLAMNRSVTLAGLPGRLLPGVRPTPLGVVAICVACVMALPVLTVLSNVFTPTDGTWSHLASTVLP